MNILVKKLSPSAIIPTKATSHSAGFDLYADISDVVIIPPHSTVKIGSGVAIKPPDGYYGAVHPRSSVATKRGLRLANCVGICDEDYRGEYIVPVHNDSDMRQYITPNERIAQVVFLPYLSTDMIEVDELDDTERGDKGFGSSGQF